MGHFEKYVKFVFIIKILFAIFLVLDLYFQYKGKSDKRIVYWKERIEFVFIVLMAIMVMYLFYPRSTKPIVIDFETKLLLFIFGIITFTKAKWLIFIEDSPEYIKKTSVFKKIQQKIDKKDKSNE